MLEYKDIEYGDLLQRCAYGEIDAYGHRFNVGNYVVIFRNKRGVVCIARVSDTVSELHKGLLELAEEFEDRNDAEWDVYRVVPTRDDDEDADDECDCDATLRTTVLVPYSEISYREFYAAVLCGIVADPYGFACGLLRGDLVAVKRQEDEDAPYCIVNVYDFVDGECAKTIIKEYVKDGARLMLLS